MKLLTYHPFKLSFDFSFFLLWFKIETCLYYSWSNGSEYGLHFYDSKDDLGVGDQQDPDLFAFLEDYKDKGHLGLGDG